MRLLILTVLTVLLYDPAGAQPSQLFFRKLTVADGLNNGHIEAIGQDARGFLWFATMTGLNRYDGYEIKTYSHIAGDTNSIPPSAIRSFAVDSSGRLMAGHEDGLLVYDPQADIFRPIHALKGYWITSIVPVNRSTVYIATFSGLIRYNPLTQQISHCKKAGDTLLGSRISSLLKRGNTLYMASRAGLLAMDLGNEKVTRITTGPLAAMRAFSVAIDASAHIWVAGSGAAWLVRLSPNLKQYQVFDGQVPLGQHTIFNFSDLKADQKGRIWLATHLNGLLLYNPLTQKFDRFDHDPQKIWTPSTGLHYAIFCDREGMLWVGGNNGLNYVHPDKNLFHIIPAFGKDQHKLNRRIARVATEDKNGNLWFGTIDGLVRYDPRTGLYTEWNNREGKRPAIYYNSIRGIYCDEENNIWIATGGGINKYVQHTGQMIFFKEKDSIPPVFYFSLDRDRSGRLWFGTRDRDGFYFYDPRHKKFHSLTALPPLKRFTGYGGRKLYQDRRGRYWLGFNGMGVGMYDPATGKTHHWMASTGKQPGIAGNLIVDIKEDKKGVIWVSSFNGLSAFHPENLSIKNYNHSNGLINSSVSALEVDERNRLWIGTGSGLMMLDSTRQYFSVFGLQHGMPSIEMPEHAGSALPNGDIIMPTQNGYIRFNPLKFSHAQKPLVPFIQSFTVADKTLPASSATFSLQQEENAFRIGFAAINFDHAGGAWYAYKLEGLDKDWTYTRQRFADYSRLPGGNYTFRLKASTDREHWVGDGLQVSIQVATIYYKTWWFYLLILVTALGLIYGIYRYRMRQQKQVLELKGRAQLLEKEKTLALYESLKQQLNPHFLFNSLTSLSGLIATNQQMAGDFLEQMSKIYRYILKSRDSELVTLYEEIRFVQVYITLQKTRFQEGLQVHIQIPEDARYFKIVPVTLQNMVENAIKHNVLDPDAPLVIDIYAEGDYLIVKNNLQKKQVIESSNKQGLTNLQSLYQYLSPRKVVIEETGQYFMIKIPLV